MFGEQTYLDLSYLVEVAPCWRYGAAAPEAVHFEGTINMRVFLVALIGAAVVAAVAAVILGEFQTSAAVGFATSAVRL